MKDEKTKKVSYYMFETDIETLEKLKEHFLKENLRMSHSAIIRMALSKFSEQKEKKI
jgi:hypothetical protein